MRPCGGRCRPCGRGPGRPRCLADLIDSRGGRWRHTLYSVDPDLSQRYLGELGCHLLGRVRVAGRDIVPLADRDALGWDPILLRILHLGVAAVDRHGIPSARGEVRSITLDDEVFLRADHGPAGLLAAFEARMAAIDPDIILTDTGDRVDLPALHPSPGSRACGPPSAAMAMMQPPGRGSHPVQLRTRAARGRT